MNAEILNILIVGASLALVWLTLRALRSYKIDATRQDLYRLRDELFDYALSDQNGLDFDSQSYNIMRSTIHGAIRYTHRSTMLHLALQARIIRKNKAESMVDFSSTWQSALEELPPIDQQRMEEFRNEKNFIVIKHAASISPITILVALFFYARLMIEKGFKNFEASFAHEAHQQTSRIAAGLSVDEDNFRLGNDDPMMAA